VSEGGHKKGEHEVLRQAQARYGPHYRLPLGADGVT